jgi:uncharacterized membrane protein
MFEKTQNLFVFLALIFGLSFLALVPPFQVPDEMTHFLRAYQVAEGGWVSEKRGELAGGDLPIGLWQLYGDFSSLPFHPEQKVQLSFADYRERLTRPLNRDHREFIHFPNTSNYSALVYLPQAAGIRLGNAFGASALALFYLGRLGNLFAWIALIYLTIRKAGFFRTAIMVSALLPMSLHQAASLSADALVNGAGTLLIAICLTHILIDESRLNTLDLGLLAALSIGLSLMKQAYLPLILLIWLIPSRRFVSPLSRYLFAGSVTLGAFLVFIGWTYIVSKVTVPMKAEAVPLRQLQEVLHHPFEFLAMLGRSYWENGHFYVEQFFGQLGWLDVILPLPLILLLATMLLAVVLSDQEPALNISWRFKSLCLGIVLLCLLALSLAIWVTWNPPGTRLIEGIQGRYFIPFSLLALVPFYNRYSWLRLEPPRLNWAALGLVSISLCWTLAVVFHRYYG